jgi:hypothetical protein
MSATAWHHAQGPPRPPRTASLFHSRKNKATVDLLMRAISLPTGPAQRCIICAQAVPSGHWCFSSSPRVASPSSMTRSKSKCGCGGHMHDGYHGFHVRPVSGSDHTLEVTKAWTPSPWISWDPRNCCDVDSPVSSTAAQRCKSFECCRHMALV